MSLRMPSLIGRHHQPPRIAMRSLPSPSGFSYSRCGGCSRAGERAHQQPFAALGGARLHGPRPGRPAAAPERGGPAGEPAALCMPPVRCVQTCMAPLACLSVPESPGQRPAILWASAPLFAAANERCLLMITLHCADCFGCGTFAPWSQPNDRTVQQMKVVILEVVWPGGSSNSPCSR